MLTQLLRVDPGDPDPRLLARAAKALQSGGLVAFPTETVYGLGADATSHGAVARIFEAKQRPASDPLIVHIAALEELRQAAQGVPPQAYRLAEAFWPGPLTLVLPRGERIPPNVSAGRSTVAVRMPRHPVALALLEAAQRPIAAPSANLFSRPSPTTAQHVLEDLDGRIDLVLDAGPAAVGIESTVLDLTVEPPAVLRPGGVSIEALRAVVPGVALQLRRLAADSVAAAPGMLLKHYSPQAEVRVYSGDGALQRMLADLERLARQGRGVGALAFDEERDLFTGATAVESLGSRQRLDEAAQRLFRGLRALDRQGVDVILARAPPPEGLGLAVRDRLVRAAEGRLIET